jgi:2-oxoisovalerate dehydrogenase E1 component alpha subunit
MGRRNSRPLTLHIPTPRGRPGDLPDFTDWTIPDAGEQPRPKVDAPAASLRALAFDLIRVLDMDGRPRGPWDPKLSVSRLTDGLRHMLVTRAYDERMFRAQRQGKTSFYMKCAGEEAVAVAQAMALHPEDMCFPTYRQQGLLVARGCPLQEMMCQVFSNGADPLKGRQMPVFYSSREHGFFSISGNVGTQFSQAVGWAMASAYRGDDKIATAWIGEGSSAEGDFHYALTLASVYRAPVVLVVVNNQWAISSYRGIANGEDATFAARGLGYGIPALRVDGNDFLALFAVTAWAAERARLNLGPTLVEVVTYRAEGHSTSDDPSKYRPAGEASAWPLGDPIDRLRRCLELRGDLAAGAFGALQAEADAAVRTAFKAAEEIGTLSSGRRPSPATMFEDVYKTQPWHLRRQRQEAGF